MNVKANHVADAIWKLAKTAADGDEEQQRLARLDLEKILHTYTDGMLKEIDRQIRAYKPRED